jgi:hypothetical protein
LVVEMSCLLEGKQRFKCEGFFVLILSINGYLFHPLCYILCRLDLEEFLLKLNRKSRKEYSRENSTLASRKELGLAAIRKSGK